MPAEITMPQLSDTMTEGTVVKWHKKEGDKVRAGEEIADVETDKAVMPMEAFDGGTLALIKAKEGEKVQVGGLLAVIAGAGDKIEDIKQKYASAGGATAPKPPAPKPAVAAAAQPAPAPKPPTPAPAPAPAPAAKITTTPGKYDYEILVIGGGPAGYAAAIRA